MLRHFAVEEARVSRLVSVRAIVHPLSAGARVKTQLRTANPAPTTLGVLTVTTTALVKIMRRVVTEELGMGHVLVPSTSWERIAN